MFWAFGVYRKCSSVPHAHPLIPIISFSCDRPRTSNDAEIEGKCHLRQQKFKVSCQHHLSGFPRNEPKLVAESVAEMNHCDVVPEVAFYYQSCIFHSVCVKSPIVGPNLYVLGNPLGWGFIVLDTSPCKRSVAVRYLRGELLPSPCLRLLQK